LLDTLCTLLALSRRELVVLVAAFVLSLPAVTPRIYASDEIQYFSYLRSLAFDRDVSFENEYRYFYEQKIGRGEGFHATFLELSTDAGRRPSFATIGCAILWAPFYGGGHLVATARGYPADGFSYPYVAAVAYGSAFYGFAAVLLSIAAARRVLGAGLLAGVIVWLGTPLLFYMYVSPPYSHACSAFAVALFVTVWLHVRDSPIRSPRRPWTIGGAAALGVTGALMAMVREQDMILALGPAMDFGLTVMRGRARPTAVATREGGPARAQTNADIALVAVSGCIGFALGLLPQLLAYKALNGHYAPSSLVVRKMHWDSPHALQVLGSPEHGFFVWTPLAAIAIAGLVVLAIRGPVDARRIGGCALLMVGLQIYVSGSVESWTVAGAFGQRRFVALTILLTIGLSAVLTLIPRRPWRLPIGAALALCVWWNLALMAEFGTGMMNRQRLDPRQNAYDAFVTLPRMLPDLAYRYLTDRGSFYRRED
jgi:hypothetical protein